ncbi:ribosomal L7Ae/L30e/S12e/Gadd45 family protein [Alkalicella caledoniensis]|uniref:Ribosomal L7Ae/L30e/S12e/Gadd45 family protein n=1 Tax=Alkalicella caledoniensis TaxID=2731377 RepID=A0A7G9W7Y5_ALKCA|nr:ribosomal L7Ae/L30e/S12e/Gadd45 family protein [Alkalicella caledoniensis]QNO14797.1 ribosomal L7Ae/L30e/S12e/Gadd45 family protein [Alkalicella caledoniensis]
MAMQQLATASKKAVGMKQTKKAVEKGEAKLVYLAKDADDHILNPLLKLCQQKQIEYHLVENMALLGEACGIQVGAAAAAILGD